MSQILPPGTRVTFGSDGKRTHIIPVSTRTDTAATAPEAPTGSRLVSSEYVQRPDGGRDYVFTYESIQGSTSGTASDRQQEINGTATTEPIETNPRFTSSAGGGGVVTQTDLLEIRKALDEGREPVFTGTGSALTAAERLFDFKLKAVDSYYAPSGITYSETRDESAKPSLRALCKIGIPPSDAPELEPGGNWLLVGLRALKVVNPNGGTFWRVTREWLASGSKGWDKVLYG